MNEDRVTIRSVAWQELMPWLCLVRVFRIAIDVRKLVLAAVAVFAVGFGWWMLDWLGADPYAKPIDLDEVSNLPLDHYTNQIIPAPIFGLAQQHLTFGTFLTLTLGLLWTVAVWGFFGGVISRLAAVELAAEERLSLGSALRHATRKWFAYFGAPLFPLIGVVIACVPLLIVGLLMRFDVGLAVASVLFWPFALLAGAAITLLLLGLMFGWPLMFATISVEATDGFDAISRSFSYVFQRPLNYLFYAVVAGLIGMAGWMVVWAFAAGTIHFAIWGVSWGCGVERTAILPGATLGVPPLVRDLFFMNPVGLPVELTGTAAAGVSMIRFWNSIVQAIALGYLASYFWTAGTAIYLLLRRDADATEFDDVYLEIPDETYGLPPLTTDDQGAPVVTTETGSFMPPHAASIDEIAAGGVGSSRTGEPFGSRQNPSDG